MSTKQIIIALATICAIGCGQTGWQITDKQPASPDVVNGKSKDRPLSVTEWPFSEQYAVVIGAYRQLGLVTKKSKECSEKGFVPYIVKYSNGLNAVTLLPTNDKEKALKNLDFLIYQGLCPPDGWIVSKDRISPFYDNDL